MVKLLVIYEDAGSNYSAYVPDLPDCVSTGATREEVARNIRDATALHLAGMRADGERLPEPVETWAAVVTVSEEEIARGGHALAS